MCRIFLGLNFIMEPCRSEGNRTKKGRFSLDRFRKQSVVRWDQDTTRVTQRDLIGEEPLSIRIQGKPYSVVMRTPGDELAHVAGFCLAEGIIDTQDDYTSMAFCDGDDTNVVTVTLSAARRSQISQILDRRGFISQTSCGLCGKELVSDLIQQIKPLPDGRVLDRNRVFQRLEALRDIQPLRKTTRAAHAAAVYDGRFDLLAVAEDVGRHNAVDKAIGAVFLDANLDAAAFLVMSSRISYELVQKASRARIPILVAISRPTALAVELASHLNMTLACLAEGDGLYIFCGKERLN